MCANMTGTMSQLAVASMIAMLGVACSQSAPDDGADPQGTVGRSSQFLASCSESCPEPLSCVCGVCTAACTTDESCGQYSGNATCVLPPTETECQSAEPSCDVPCSHDGRCERLGDAFVCLVGRCRRQAADASSGDAGLTACASHAPIVSTCVLPIEGFGGFGNDRPPLQGTVVALGDAEARLECFGSDNFGAAIPVAARPGEQPAVPEGTEWWRVDDGATVYTVALAAPGLEALGVSVGDSVSIRHAVSWGGWDWPMGNAEIDIEGRGRVLIAINDSSLLDVADGPAHCERPGPCGGQEWSMRIEADGEQISVPPFESLQVGKSLFTNAGALTHHTNYMEPDETTEGTQGCKGEPRTNFIAARVDAE